MKLTIKTGFYFGHPCVIAVANLRVNGKRRQKTWHLQTVAPEFTKKFNLPAIEREAARWEKSILHPVIVKPPIQEALL